MGGLRAPTKDFVQLIAQAKKIIKLMKASILLFLSPFPTRPPTERWIRLSPAFLDQRTFYHIPPQLLRCKFGWLLCAVVDWRPPNAAINFVQKKICPLTGRPKRCDSVLPHRDRPARRLPQLYPIA